MVCPLSNLVEERGDFAEEVLPTKTTSANGKVKEADKAGFKARTKCAFLRSGFRARRRIQRLVSPSRILPAIVVILRAAKNLAVVFVGISREDADYEKTVKA